MGPVDRGDGEGASAERIDMSMLQQFARLLRELWHWTGRESELDEEIRFHLSQETEEHLASGLSPEEARRAAERDFGNAIRVRERTHDVWVAPWLQDLGQDVRFAGRLLVKDRWLTLTIVVTLAIGCQSGPDHCDRPFACESSPQRPPRTRHAELRVAA